MKHATSLLALALLVAAPARAQEKLELPAPRGYVNDFANAIPDEMEPAIAARIQAIRDSTGGVIVAVTLPTLGGRSRDEVALQIGREWKVGEEGTASIDRAAQAGTVVLVVPSERQIKIELGTGTNRFITAAEAGRVRDAMVPHLRSGDVGQGMLTAVDELGRHYEREAAEQAAARLGSTSVPRQEEGGSGFLPILLLLGLAVTVAGLLVWRSESRKRRAERERRAEEAHQAWRAERARHLAEQHAAREPARVYHLQTPDSARAYAPSSAPRRAPSRPATPAPAPKKSSGGNSSRSSSGSSYTPAPYSPPRYDDDHHRSSGYGGGYGGGGSFDFGGGGDFSGGGAGGDY